MHTTTICLVRHGETAWNAERRIQGHLDVPLNDTGRAQADALAAALATQHFDAVHSSDLTRARTTAEAVARRLALAVYADPALRERDYGDFQGLTYAQAEKRFPEDYARLIARAPDHVPPGGGESLADLAARVRATLTRIAVEHAGGRVLVVTHGGVLDAAHRMATGNTLDAPRDFVVANAALNWIEHRDGTWALLSWDEREHLAATRDELSRS
ncbi:MAG: histidine phosphatase family protein [Azoarcus sp.]|nr:histidine phosphatase family protein [Azoarcus sp.]